jgi:threonine aldolase
MTIDLRSDTLTKPTPAMLQAMMNAEVGDDVFSEDPSVEKLEALTAAMFGMEAGLFCPSGTMTNQIAVKVHTQPLDEVICDKLCHIYNYEVGGYAFHSGVSVRLTDGDRGIMTTDMIERCILPDYDWYPNTKLVCIENTVNKGGGAVYTVEQMKAIGDLCRARGLAYHLDGARIFNALTALGKKSNDLAGIFDTVSVCISKGLGAPAGSVLVGPRGLIKKARKIRKVMGGGMRQAGYLAAACIYALEHNIGRLSEDHRKAKQIEALLKKCSWVKQVLPVETNIVIFEVADSAHVSEALTALGIRTSPFSPTLVRMVTHLDITDEMMVEFERVLMGANTI